MSLAIVVVSNVTYEILFAEFFQIQLLDRIFVKQKSYGLGNLQLPILSEPRQLSKPKRISLKKPNAQKLSFPNTSFKQFYPQCSINHIFP